MGTWRSLIGRQRGAAWLVLCAALVLRLVVPSGFMPALDPAGHLVAQICGGSGAVSLDLGPAAPHHDGDHSGDSCPYAPLGAAALGAGDPPALASAPLPPPPPWRSAARTFLPAPPTTARPPARAPPVPLG